MKANRFLADWNEYSEGPVTLWGFVCMAAVGIEGKEGSSRMEEDKKPIKREITYQIGWKKGRMEIGQDGKVTGSHTGPLLLDAGFWIRIMTKTTWRSSLPLTDKLVYGLLWTVPPIAFGLTWLLVFFLG